MQCRWNFGYFIGGELFWGRELETISPINNERLRRQTWLGGCACVRTLRIKLLKFS